MPLVCLITCSSKEEALRIARALVHERLAACVNLVHGLHSIYWWKGAVEEAEEALLVVKTTRERLPALVDRVRALHTYTVPEVVALPIEGGNPDYLTWVVDSVAAR
ncbi:MAG: divalent-cation tolerance protein CutA [Armatimonadota bacterium]|nr:divalent-cation tolerance protein CutA [Armatimonadota bacterium]MDR7601822.1 divalent-cation tolerance protein CutA [Armatimonadota bacterium]